jgi:tetratricopeptide (TPR) repeat protein
VTELSIEQVRERAHESSEENPTQRLVAVLIMTATVLAAVTAFLQTQSGTRQAVADRDAQAASVATMSAFVESNRRFSEQSVIAALPSDLGWLRFYLLLDATGSATPYSLALSRSYGAAQAAAQRQVNGLFGGSYRANGGFDYEAFYADQLKPGYRTGEVQKAAAKERSGWAAKRGRYITVITIFAVALFLLGLTLTVPARAGRPFVWMGTAVALGATIWGVVLFAHSVPKRSEAGIDAYVDGAVKIDVAEQLQPEGQRPATYRAALADLTRAIRKNSSYREAYFTRGYVYFSLDLLRPGGPRGSEVGRADLKHAIHLDSKDYVSWGNLGASDFWLGDYGAALEENQKALSLNKRDPIFEMNEGLYLAVLGRTDDYRAQLVALRDVLAHIPDWLRHQSLVRYEQVIRLGERYRQQIAPQVETFNQDLLKIAHEIEVSTRMYGDPTPRSTAAKVGRLAFGLSSDGTTVRARFHYTGMKPGDRWLYDVYVNGERSDTYSSGPPRRWAKSGFPSDGSLVLTLRTTATTVGDIFKAPRWESGTAIRAEIFVDGNLLSAREYSIP